MTCLLSPAALHPASLAVQRRRSPKPGKGRNQVQREVTQILQDIIRSVLRIDALNLTPEMTAGQVQGWDSFAMVEILIRVEERFGIEFDTPEIDGIETVGDFIDAIETRLSRT